MAIGHKLTVAKLAGIVAALRSGSAPGQDGLCPELAKMAPSRAAELRFGMLSRLPDEESEPLPLRGAEAIWIPMPEAHAPAAFARSR